MTKLSDETVQRIKSLAAKGLSNKILAERFGVTVAQINRIVNGVVRTK